MRAALRLSTGIFVTFGLVAPGWAQEVSIQDLSKATLEQLLNVRVITATRNAEGLADAPARVDVVTASQIQRRGYRSLADLLRDLPDFKLDLGVDPDFPSDITVQGVRGTSHLVVLLDGIRISSPTNEPLPILANYPVHNARQVEIVYGPASALYGADAFSGVINIISKDVGDAPGAAVSTTIGQFGLYNQTGSYGARLGQKTTLMVAGQYLSDQQPDLSKYYPDDFQGMVAQRTGTFNSIFGPMTSSRPVPAEYESPMSAHSLMATLRSGPVQITMFENHARVPSAQAYTPDNVVYSGEASNLNRMFVVAGSYTKPLGPVTSTTTLSFSRHELAPDSGYWNVFSNFERSYKYAYGSMAKAETQLSWKAGRSVTMTTGGAFERYFAIPQGADLNAPLASHDAPGTILGTNIPDALVKLRYSNTAGYAQMQYAMRPSVALTVGARADYNTRYGATVNPRLGAVMRPAEGTTVKVLFGSAFLAPSPYQSYSHYGSFYSVDGGETYASSYWHLPNPDLEPERKQTLEVNLRQALGGQLFLDTSAFYSRLTNLIKGADADRAYSGTYLGWPVDYIDFPVNEGDATTYGGTVRLNFLRSFGLERSIAAYGAISLVDGRVRGDDESDLTLPIGAMVPVQLRFGADLEWDKWSVAPRLAILGRQRLLATTPDEAKRETIDGYATVDVNVRRNRIFRNMGVFVTLENAFDGRYRNINVRGLTNPEELVGAPQNPRRLSVGFDLRFR